MTSLQGSLHCWSPEWSAASSRIMSQQLYQTRKKIDTQKVATYGNIEHVAQGTAPWPACALALWPRGHSFLNGATSAAAPLDELVLGTLPQ